MFKNTLLHLAIDGSGSCTKTNLYEARHEGSFFKEENDDSVMENPTPSLTAALHRG